MDSHDPPLAHRPASYRQRTDSSASKSNNNNNSASTPIPGEDYGADMPMTMSASAVLTSLPRDAHQALADAEAIDTAKSESRNLSKFITDELTV